MLVVVLILELLMAVALPLYLSAEADAQLKTCRANMQTIANAAQAWYTSNGAQSPYSTLKTLTAGNLHTVLTDLPSDPICPAANKATYTIVTDGYVKDATGNPFFIPTGAFGVTCSTAGHGGFIPGVMGN